MGQPLYDTVIKVSKLNGQLFFINALYIETIESLPDTTITLTNGNRYIVREKEATVLQMITQFYRSINLLGQQLRGNDHEK